MYNLVTLLVGLMNTKSISRKKGPDQCAQCSRKFLTHQECKTHVDEHYGKWKYKCFFTVSTFVLPIPIMFFDNVHIAFFCASKFFLNNVHTVRCDEVPFLASALNMYLQPWTIWSFFCINFRIECVQCGNFFGRPNKYEEHIQKKGPSHNDQCAQCSRKFLTHEEYKTHVVDEHYGKWKYKCGHCEETFDEKKELKHHSFIHPEASVETVPVPSLPKPPGL